MVKKGQQQWPNLFLSCFFSFRGIFWEDKGHLQPLLRTKNVLYTVHTTVSYRALCIYVGTFTYILYLVYSGFFVCLGWGEVVTGVKWLSKKGWLFLTSSRTFGLGWLSKKCPRLKEVRFFIPSQWRRKPSHTFSWSLEATGGPTYK